ncbi:MAG: hypothetical protein ACHP7K_03180 [Actinomycetales bacterium]
MNTDQHTVALVQSFGGAAHALALLEAGTTKRRLSAAVAGGRLIRPGRGVYMIPGAAADVVQARIQRALLTCSSAAEHYGLWLLRRPTRLHLTSRRGRLPAEFAAHRRPVSAGSARLPYPALDYVLLHSLRCLPFMDALVLVECAVGRGDAAWRPLAHACRETGTPGRAGSWLR